MGGTDWEGVIGQRSNNTIWDDTLGIYSSRALGEKVVMKAPFLAGKKL